MALGSTQPITEMSTRNIFWGVKAARCVGLTNLPPSCADYVESWESQPPGTLRACLSLYRDYFSFLYGAPKFFGNIVVPLLSDDVL